MRPETIPWWRQAEADLETAELTLRGGQFYAASWFAQQAAEKALKALYFERHGRLAPRSHDLEYLGRQLGVPQVVDADLTALNPTFDQTRYPDDYGVPPVDAIGETDATGHVALARSVLQWVQQHL